MNERVAATLRDDPTMARLIDRHGPLTVEPAADEFARLCTSIVNQQLSTASAAAIHERFLDVVGGDPTPALAGRKLSTSARQPQATSL